MVLIITSDIVCRMIKEFKLLAGRNPTSRDLVILISIRYFRGKPLSGVHMKQVRDILQEETQRGGSITEQVTTFFDVREE